MHNIMQAIKEIEQLSIKLNAAYNPSGIVLVLEEYFSHVNIFIYDSTSETLRDFSKSWISIDESMNKENSKELYSVFDKLKEESFVLSGNHSFYALYKGQKLI